MPLSVTIEKRGAEPILHCPFGISPGDAVRVDGRSQFATHMSELGRPLTGRVTRVMPEQHRIEVQFADLECPSRYRLPRRESIR